MSSENHAVVDTAERPERRGWGPMFEVVFHRLTQLCGLLVLLLLASLLLILLRESFPTFQNASEYKLFTSKSWQVPASEDDPPNFGTLGLIYGTLITAFISMLIAVPLGVGTAAYLAEIASPRVRKVGAFLIELLAAIPSVVYGFWGYFFLIPRLRPLFESMGAEDTTGKGILAASITLAIMILPYITAISFDACRSVPQSQRQGSLALGATRWQMILSVVLPYAKPGIYAAFFLALGRALGETMAVTMLIGNNALIELSLFAKGNTIPSAIATELLGANSSKHTSALIALGLILLVITAGVNMIARLLISRMGRPRTKASRPMKISTNPTPLTDLPVITAADCAEHSARNLRVNSWMTWFLRGSFILATLPLFMILAFICINGASGLSTQFFFSDARNPNPLIAGLGHAMIGSLIMVSMATVVAVPIGILAAVYLSEARNSRLADSIRFGTELLTGVPSIIVGLFVYILLVKSNILGLSAYSGAIALAIMMIPIIIRSAEESLKMVPDSLRQASYALGASRIQTVFRVIIPAAIPAIVTGVFLAIGRIAGETAPLLLTAGGYSRFTTALGEQMPFLPNYIYKYSISPPTGADPTLWHQQAWAGAFVLLTVVMTLNVGIRLLAGNRVVAASRAD